MADVIGAQQPAKADTSDRFREAQRILQTAGVDEARTFLKKHFQTAQDQPHYDILLARLLNGTNQPLEARRVLEELAQRHKDRLDVRFVFAERAVRQNRWFEGWIHLTAADQARIPEHWTTEYINRVRRDLVSLKAQCCEGRSDWATARNLYSELVQSDDDQNKQRSIQWLTGLGRCEFHLDRLDNAAEQFAASFQTDSDLDVPDLVLAVLCDANARHDEARKYFQRAIRHGDDAGRGRAELAYARWLLWNNEPESVSKVLRTQHTNSALQRESTTLLAMSYRMQQQFEEARQCLTPMYQSEPDSFSVSNQLALVMIETTDEALRSRAMQIAEANARNHSQLAEAWATLGWIQFRLGDLASARRNLSRAMSGGRVSRDTAWHLAQVHQRLGHEKEAVNLINAARTSRGPLFTSLPE